MSKKIVCLCLVFSGIILVASEPESALGEKIAPEKIAAKRALDERATTQALLNLPNKQQKTNTSAPKSNQPNQRNLTDDDDSERGSHSPAYLLPYEDDEHPRHLRIKTPQTSPDCNWSAHFENSEEYTAYLNSLDYGPNYWRERSLYYPSE